MHAVNNEGVYSNVKNTSVMVRGTRGEREAEEEERGREGVRERGEGGER